MKQDFTDTQIADFLRRSYFVVDGLWFIKTEEKRGFDEAMETDEAVWDVMCRVHADLPPEGTFITKARKNEMTKGIGLNSYRD